MGSSQTALDQAMGAQSGPVVIAIALICMMMPVEISAYKVKTTPILKLFAEQVLGAGYKDLLHQKNDTEAEFKLEHSLAGDESKAARATIATALARDQAVQICVFESKCKYNPTEDDDADRLEIKEKSAAEKASDGKEKFK